MALARLGGARLAELGERVGVELGAHRRALPPLRRLVAFDLLLVARVAVLLDDARPRAPRVVLPRRRGRQRALEELAAAEQELAGEPAVLLTSGMLRPVLSRFLKNAVNGLHVLSYQEIPDDKQVRIVSSVGQESDRHPDT